VQTDRHALPGFYRIAQGLRISSIGIGTYRGARDPATDASYLAALRTAFRGGIRLVDTAIVYRDQQCERLVGTAIREFLENGDGTRDDLVVCTKGGYIVPQDDTREVAEMHCIEPAFLAGQLSRSLRNLGLTTIDVYYIHNPEVQLRALSARKFLGRMRRAFECLEAAVSRGAIRYYGAATWPGLIDGMLSLPALADAARDVAGDGHHFRFIQLPFNLETQEALNGGVLQEAAERGMTVVASAPLGQGSLAADLACALQFARSAPGIAAALVGMSSSQHVEEALAVAVQPPLTPGEFDRLRKVGVHA